MGLWAEDGVMNICLQKAAPGEAWRGAFEGHALHAHVLEEDKKRLLLERFQTEVAGSMSNPVLKATGCGWRNSMQDLTFRGLKSLAMRRIHERF